MAVTPVPGRPAPRQAAQADPVGAPRGRLRPGSVARGAAWTLAAAVPLAFLAVFFAWPVAALVGRGFWLDGALDLGGFAEVFAETRTWRIIGITLAQAAAGTVLSVLLGVPGAYVLYRCTFRGRTFARGLVTVPFVLPTVVVGVAFRAVLAPGGPLGFLGLDQTFAAIVMALVFFNYSVVVRTVGGLWERLDPRAEQAARALGASPARAFRTVTLPALAPAIASAASIVFLFCAAAFGIVLVLGPTGYGTVETEIYVQTTQFLDLRAAAVLSVVQLVVVSGALLAANRTRARREQALALMPEASAGRPLRARRDAASLAVTVAVVLGLLALPIGTLVARSLRASDGAWTLDNYRNLATTGGRNALSVTVWEAAAISLRTAAVAAVVAVTVGVLVALVVSRRPRARSGRRALALLDSVFMLPLGVSAVTVGFGFLITLDRPLGLDVDLRTSGLLVPLAQAVVAVPLVVRVILPVLRAIDPRLREAAGTLGAPPGRVLATVDLPVMLRPLGLAIGFAFATSLGEFGATSFLARPESATLPVVIYRLIGKPGPENYGMALAASVVLALVTATVMMLAERLRGQGAGEL
ncbi:ABC transporter permease [Paraoerskovia sediminicola]|uniref:ABC transporter permease n=1 Tax=Paraoerskovia sediminicola TaxID=1138587 RepID=A0ABN6XFM2_9CELL|nr:iron ABC transporter permease [Paraoerskovia sediminicola]BDZ42406.1 ABC transporter permease [Paraoerskovia sediminicola]